MAGFKSTFYSLFKIIAPLLPVRHLIKKRQNPIILPFYHAVSNEPLPHIKHLYEIRNAQTFENDIKTFLKYFDPISVPQLIKHIRGEEIITRPSFLISFDDGLRSFGETAAPLLEKYNLEAICFLNSGFVDNRDIFYRYKASLLIEHLQHDRQPKNIEAAKSKLSVSSKDELMNALKKVDYEGRHILDEICHDLELNFDDFLSEQKPYLNSEEIVDLIDRGFYFGGHSIDHPYFNNLEINEQVNQTVESLQWIKKQFQAPFNLFAFPFSDFGIAIDYFEGVNRHLNIDAFFGTAGLNATKHDNHLQRVPMEPGGYSAEQRIRLEYLYYFMKHTIGKN